MSVNLKDLQIKKDAPNILQTANQNIEQVATEGLKIGMKGLQWVGNRMEDLDKSVNLRNIAGLPSEQDYKSAGMTSPPEPKWQSDILDYSFHDLRGHAAGGFGNVAGAGSRLLGADPQTSEKINDVAETIAQVVIPQTADFAAGAGYYKRLLINSPRLAKLAIKAADTGNTKVWRSLGNALNPELAIAGMPGITTRNVDELANLGSVLKIDKGGAALGGGLATRTAALRKQPKVSALGRYDLFRKQGYEMTEAMSRKAETIRKGDFSQKLKGLTQWDDKEAYRKRAQKLYDAGTPSADIREIVGVYVDPKSGEVLQMMSRKKGPKLDLRNPWGEGVNTEFNRKLSLVQQQANDVPNYNATKTVQDLIKRDHPNFKLDPTKKGTLVDQFKAKYAIHHRRSIVAYEPFFHNLDAKDAKKLRGLIEADGIKLGDNLDNLVAIPKSKHTLDKDSIHTWMRQNGIEGVSKNWLGKVGSYDAQASLRKRFAKASVDQRYEAFKLYLEYVQEPTDVALNKILAAMK